MKCFVHHEKDAVGACKHCGKGLCTECVVEAKGGVSCRGVCEEHVEALRQLTQRAIGMHPRVSASHSRNAIYVGLSGVVFLSLGLLGEFRELSYFMIAMAIVSFVGAGLFLRSAAEFKKKN